MPGSGETLAHPIHGSCLVSTFPLISGHGEAFRRIRDLGFFETDAFYKFRRRDTEGGYSEIVRPRLLPGEASLALSLYLPSVWSHDIARFRLAHLTSPHLFHLVKYNGNCTGLVHDLLLLSGTSWRDRHASGYRAGYRFLISRTIRYAHRLKGVVTISRATDEALHEHNPRVNSRVIHHWTGDEMRYREREAACQELGLPVDRIILLQTSLDVPHKNLSILPRIMELLDRRYLLVRIGDSRAIQGRFPPGSLRWVPSVAPGQYPLYFNAADALLMPSRAEGFGFPVIQAINSSTPVIASDIPVFREILGPTYPMLADPDDSKQWATLCKEIPAISRDPAARQNLFRRLGDYYRAPRGFDEYSAFFKDLGFLSQ
jgi:glycosyltransferase involved in cell wall biosynthesis